MTQENKDLLVAEVLNNVNLLSTKLEQLATKKKALNEPGESSIVGQIITAHKEAVKAIADESKATRKAIEAEIKRVDAVAGASIVTTVCMAPEGADDAFRQRLARRRNSLRNTLASCFADYDFRTDKIANRAVITAVRVGDEFIRSANSMLAVVGQLSEMGFEIPDIDRDNLADILRRQAGVTKTYSLAPVEDGVPSVKDTLAALNDIITGTAGKTVEEAQQEQQEQQEQQA